MSPSGDVATGPLALAMNWLSGGAACRGRAGMAPDSGPGGNGHGTKTSQDTLWLLMMQEHKELPPLAMKEYIGENTLTQPCKAFCQACPTPHIQLSDGWEMEH